MLCLGSSKFSDLLAADDLPSISIETNPSYQDFQPLPETNISTISTPIIPAYSSNKQAHGKSSNIFIPSLSQAQPRSHLPPSLPTLATSKPYYPTTQLTNVQQFFVAHRKNSPSEMKVETRGLACGPLAGGVLV